ncbi:MAG: hypothetical protein QOE77_4140 [Blastocatellia bacterium]|nr:hypothetical protein [Blastocatellia bacterium]
MSQIAYARLSDGRRLTFEKGRRCGAMRIRGVRSNVSVTIQAYGVRQDMEGGKVATATLKSKRAKGGAKGKAPRRICR